MGKSSRIRRRAAESRRKGPQPTEKPPVVAEEAGDVSEQEGEAIFVPEDAAFKAALQEWDRVNEEIEGYVNHAGLLDMEDPEQAALGQQLEVAADAIRASLKALGYESVRFLTNLFFYENNTNPEQYPDGHFDRLTMQVE